jgi:hypothetical protein
MVKDAIACKPHSQPAPMTFAFNAQIGQPRHANDDLMVSAVEKISKCIGKKKVNGKVKIVTQKQSKGNERVRA